MKLKFRLVIMTILFSVVIPINNVEAHDHEKHDHENDKVIVEYKDGAKIVIERTAVPLDGPSTRAVVICGCGGTSRTKVSTVHVEKIYSQESCSISSHHFGIVTVYYEYDSVKYRCNSCGDITTERQNAHLVTEHRYVVYP